MKLCPFCHTWVSENIWDSHLDSHTRILPDGQMKDHITVRPEERFQGNIAKEPQWYVHPRCGGVTGMPEEIIRSYIADPFLYNESSFCTGCGTYVPTSELFWQETNESLHAASCRRKAEFIKQNHLNPDDFVWDAQGPVKRKSQGGGGGWGVAVVAIGAVAALFLLGFVFLFGLVAFRAQARPKRAQPAAAFPAGFDRDFARPDFADFPKIEIPKGPDMNEIMKDHEKRMEEIHKRNEEMMDRLRSEPVGIPAGFDPLEGIGPPEAFSGLEEARQRSQDARQRAQERIDAARERFRKTP